MGISLVDEPPGDPRTDSSAANHPSNSRAATDQRNMRTVSSASTGRQPTRHTVLAETDSAAYHSLRQRPVTRAERYALGKSLRKRVPRRSLADWTPPSDRPDPIDLIKVSHQGRVDRLIPIRVGRMVDSPYGFLRGTAVVMAEDVAHLPATGITPVVCGDSHLGNFGFYASPERDLVIDLNDFDEAHPGGWEWDLRRLVASIWVAGRHNGASEDALRRGGAVLRLLVPSGVAPAGRPAAVLALLHPAGRRPAGRRDGRSAAEEVARSAKRARHRTSDRALPRFTHEVDGVRKIVEEPPLITRLPSAKRTSLAEALDEYLRDAVLALAPRARRLHAGRRRAQGRRGGQRRPARLCGAAGGFIAGGRRLPAAQAGPPVGAGALRARRVGMARAPGPAGRGIPAGTADGQRPAAGLDHDGRPAVLRAAVPKHEGTHPVGCDGRRRADRLRREWWVSCWPRGTPGPAAPR